MGAALASSLSGPSAAAPAPKKKGKKEDVETKEEEAPPPRTGPVPETSQLLQAFSMWTIDEVSDTFKRVFQLIHRAPDSDVVVTRREYLDVFIVGNLDVLRDGRFLQLPLMMFNIFDSKHTGVVNLYQVFVTLALYCSGPVDKKTQFCFYMFDIDRTGLLEKVEFDKFVCTVSEALMQIGVSTQAPSPSILRRLVDITFKYVDTNGNGVIEPAEFLEYCSNTHHLADLVSSIQKLDPSGHKRHPPLASPFRIPKYVQAARRWSVSGDTRELAVISEAFDLAGAIRTVVCAAPAIHPDIVGTGPEEEAAAPKKAPRPAVSSASRTGAKAGKGRRGRRSRGPALAPAVARRVKRRASAVWFSLFASPAFKQMALTVDAGMKTTLRDFRLVNPRVKPSVAVPKVIAAPKRIVNQSSEEEALAVTVGPAALPPIQGKRGQLLRPVSFANLALSPSSGPEDGPPVSPIVYEVASPPARNLASSHNLRRHAHNIYGDAGVRLPTNLAPVSSYAAAVRVPVSHFLPEPVVTTSRSSRRSLSPAFPSPPESQSPMPPHPVYSRPIISSPPLLPESHDLFLVGEGEGKSHTGRLLSPSLPLLSTHSPGEARASRAAGRAILLDVAAIAGLPATDEGERVSPARPLSPSQTMHQRHLEQVSSKDALPAPLPKLAAPKFATSLLATSPPSRDGRRPSPQSQTKKVASPSRA